MKFYTVSLWFDLQFLCHVLNLVNIASLEEIKAVTLLLVPSKVLETHCDAGMLPIPCLVYLCQYCIYHAVMHNFVPVFSGNYSEEYSNSLTSWWEICMSVLNKKRERSFDVPGVTYGKKKKGKPFSFSTVLLFGTENSYSTIWMSLLNYLFHDLRHNWNVAQAQVWISCLILLKSKRRLKARPYFLSLFSPWSLMTVLIGKFPGTTPWGTVPINVLSIFHRTK